MSLKNALRACGYTMQDLWAKLLAKRCKISRIDFMKCGGAYCPSPRPWWNDILRCLDEMGVDW